MPHWYITPPTCGGSLAVLPMTARMNPADSYWAYAESLRTSAGQEETTTWTLVQPLGKKKETVSIQPDMLQDHNLKCCSTKTARSMEQGYPLKVWARLRASCRAIRKDSSPKVSQWELQEVTATSNTKDQRNKYKGIWKIKETWHHKGSTIIS